MDHPGKNWSLRNRIICSSFDNLMLHLTLISIYILHPLSTSVEADPRPIQMEFVEKYYPSIIQESVRGRPAEQTSLLSSCPPKKQHTRMAGVE